MIPRQQASDLQLFLPTLLLLLLLLPTTTLVNGSNNNPFMLSLSRSSPDGDDDGDLGMYKDDLALVPTMSLSRYFDDIINGNESATMATVDGTREIIWPLPEVTMHRFPHRFGAAEDAAIARWVHQRSSAASASSAATAAWVAKTASAWASNVRHSQGCHAGMTCFWRDLLLPPTLARRTTLTLESTWERGGCCSLKDLSVSSSSQSSYRGPSDSAMCFLSPPAAASKHSITVPFPSPFSAASDAELRDHISVRSIKKLATCPP